MRSTQVLCGAKISVTSVWKITGSENCKMSSRKTSSEHSKPFWPLHWPFDKPSHHHRSVGKSFCVSHAMLGNEHSLGPSSTPSSVFAPLSS